MNKIFLVGNMGQDPESGETSGGTETSKFSLAVNNWRKEEPTWVNIVAYGNSAVFANEYLAKGNKILVEGRLEIRSGQRDDGTWWNATEVVVDNIELLIGTPKEETKATTKKRRSRKVKGAEFPTL